MYGQNASTVYPLDLAPGRRKALLEKHTAEWVGEPRARMTSRHCPSGLQTRHRKVEPSSLTGLWRPFTDLESPSTMVGPTRSVVNAGSAWLGPSLCIKKHPG